VTRRDIVAAAVGAIAATVVAGSVAWAAIPGPGGVIHGCYDKNGDLKVVEALPCPKGYTELEWNEKGDPGEPGVDGVDGTSPTVAQLAPGDSNCQAGGAAITDAGGTTAYVCSGEDGADGQPFSGTFTSPNGQYSLTVSDSGITIANGTAARIVVQSGSIDARAQQDVEVEASLNATLRGTVSATVESSATTNVRGGGLLELRGALVRVGPGAACQPAARLGDLVIVNPDSGVGSIAFGMPTVCIG
jgi:hypothetical protein